MIDFMRPSRFAITLLLGSCVTFAVVSQLLADDLNPPPWTRSGASNRSTSAEWDFDEDGTNPLLPDGNTVPLIVGDYNTQLDTQFPGGAPHPSGNAVNLTYTGSGFRNEGTALGTLAFNVPNWIDLEPFKWLRLQVTYSGDAPTTQVTGDKGRIDVTEELLATVPGTAGQLQYFYQDWILRPNPNWEQVVLFVPPQTFIDQVVIDSISTPEPGTALLAALAALPVIRLVRRYRR